VECLQLQSHTGRSGHCRSTVHPTRPGAWAVLEGQLGDVVVDNWEQTATGCGNCTSLGCLYLPLHARGHPPKSTAQSPPHRLDWANRFLPCHSPSAHRPRTACSHHAISSCINRPRPSSACGGIPLPSPSQRPAEPACWPLGPECLAIFTVQICDSPSTLYMR